VVKLILKIKANQNRAFFILSSYCYWPALGTGRGINNGAGSTAKTNQIKETFTNQFRTRLQATA
jgi:hypothetical protein